jgi:hypothetical protein
MRIISHRGNTNGPNPSLENYPRQVLDLINSKIDVEVDVWLNNGHFYLGHDRAQYRVDKDFLKFNGLWCHAKNLQALEKLIELKTVCFWHQSDDFSLTSNGLIWTFPNKPTCSKSVIVDVSKDWRNKNYNCYGICVDFLN